MPGNIMIADDEAMIAFDIEAALTDNGFNVAGMARDVQQALQLLETDKVDFAILDADLHGESAAPIAARLRAMNIPFVVASGYAADQIDWLQDARLLQKPINYEQLLSAVRGE